MQKLLLSFAIKQKVICRIYEKWAGCIFNILCSSWDCDAYS